MHITLVSPGVTAMANLDFVWNNASLPSHKDDSTRYGPLFSVANNVMENN